MLDLSSGKSEDEAAIHRALLITKALYSQYAAAPDEPEVVPCIPRAVRDWSTTLLAAGTYLQTGAVFPQTAGLQ